jgi:hypothetical protein
MIIYSTDLIQDNEQTETTGRIGEAATNFLKTVARQVFTN